MTRECAILAGGCFWGLEDLISALSGVLSTKVGYTGGSIANPTYELLKTIDTGHTEAVEIIFDPITLPYRKLLEYFFQIHNPCTMNRQGNDIGPTYRSAIYYGNALQRQIAEELIAEINTSKMWPGKIVTEIAPISKFYLAEEYHQKYLMRNPGGYSCHYIRPAWKLPK